MALLQPFSGTVHTPARHTRRCNDTRRQGRCRAFASHHTQPQQQQPVPQDATLARRNVLLSLTASLSLLTARHAHAEPVAAATDIPISESEALTPATVEEPAENLFVDDEYTFVPPPGFKFFDIPIQRREVGPAPERSPIRSRFQDPNSNASISVVVRGAQGLTFSLVQVSDVSAYGTPQEAAKLLVPRGSTVLAATSQVIDIPPRETPLGLIDIPPKSYYLYEFISPQNDHIVMSVAATRGKVVVCGAAAPKAEWAPVAQQLVASVKSFRVK